MTVTASQPTGAGATLKFVDVAKRYGAIEALQATSLECAAGEFFAIIGPSGSGKSTLLGVTAGYIPPSAGHILVAGRDIVGVPPFRRNIGMVFQHYSLFPHMTVAENIAFPLRMRKRSRAEIVQSVDRMLAMVRLEGFADRRPLQLSGGQQQRVALARAAVYDPLLLLMDEPLSALDKNLREEMQDEIKQFQHALGTTVLYVTHDQNEAAAMSDRIAIMNAGRIEQIGTPRELYEQPRNRFVASFLGEANLFEIDKTESHGSTVQIVTAQHGLRLLSTAAQPGAAKICACVRPEAIAIDRVKNDRDNCIPGKILDVTYTAGSVRYKVAVAANKVVTQRMPSTRNAVFLEPGSRVFLSWPAEATLLVADA